MKTLQILLSFMLTGGAAHAQFDYAIDSGAVIITGFDCTGSEAIIPDAIEDLPVRTIGTSAFIGCTALSSVTIPESVTTIGDQAFSGCTGLTSVAIPKSVTSIGGTAFWRCTSLSAIDVDPSNPAYSSVDGVLFNKNHDTLIQFPGAKQGHYTVPESVTAIGSPAFAGATSLTSVLIPASVTSIGAAAFRECSSLLSMTVGGVTEIAGYTFYGCTNLASVTMGNSVTILRVIKFSEK